MIPLKDYNPTRTFPVITLVLIVACVGIYFFVQPGGRSTILGSPMNEGDSDLEFTFRNAAIPCEVLEGRPLAAEEIRETVELGDDTACEARPGTPPVFPEKNVLLSVLYSMFLHGSILHLAGNMLFLWVFGNNIEDVQGKFPYVLFYLASGLAATIGHIAVQPSSTIPVVGASGAIAGVMGAYLVVFPRVQIRSLIIFFFILFRDIEARWLLGFWFVSQFFINPNEGVAWVAHVAGFVFGALGGLFWRARRPRTPAPVRYA